MENKAFEENSPQKSDSSPPHKPKFKANLFKPTQIVTNQQNGPIRVKAMLQQIHDRESET